MKIITFLLLFCLSFNVLANPVKELEASLDAYNYSLTVEWDQTDQSFYQQKTDQFLKVISHLMIDQGVTREDILSLVEKKVASKEVIEAMKLKLSLCQRSEQKISRLS